MNATVAGYDHHRFLSSEFEQLRQKAFPFAEGDQLKELRWVFFAGAGAIMDKLPDYLDENGIDPESAEGQLVLEGIDTELEIVRGEVELAALLEERGIKQ